MTFEPGSKVEERRVLPAMKQQLGGSDELLAEVPCDADESDGACRERAEAAVRAGYPRASAVKSTIAVAREQLRARYEVDGKLREETLDSVEALRERLQSLVDAGHRVALISGEPVAAPDAERHAVVHARGATSAARREVLRVALRLAPAEPIVSLLSLQARAAEQGIQLGMVSPQPDGSIEVALSCSR